MTDGLANLFNWLLLLPISLIDAFNFLFTPIDEALGVTLPMSIAPIALISITGFGILIGAKLFHLFSIFG